jgi:SPP1 gp7 family putative phage head morphogenesis protein
MREDAHTIVRIVTRADPVHPVTENGRTVGWQWGQSGNVYSTKEKAQKQAAAIYASGWRDDADVRHARRIVAQALRPHVAAERTYVRDCVAIVAGVHRGILAAIHRDVLPEYETRHDASQKKGDVIDQLTGSRMKKKVAAHVKPRVEAAFDTMSAAQDKKNKNAMTLIGIPISDAAAGVGAALAVARETNVRLIQSASDDWLDDVRDVLDEGQAKGLRIEEIAKWLQKRADVSKSRAKFIARDQSAKLAGSLNKIRQTSAGVSRYRWSTSRDERVRDMHADLEGQICDWDDPPVTDKYGNTNHPGEDFGCRCTGTPIVPGLDEEGDDSEPDEEDDDAEAAE